MVINTGYKKRNQCGADGFPFSIATFRTRFAFSKDHASHEKKDIDNILITISTIKLIHFSDL